MSCRHGGGVSIFMSDGTFCVVSPVCLLQNTEFYTSEARAGKGGKRTGGRNSVRRPRRDARGKEEEGGGEQIRGTRTLIL